jgi:hypothetical protein
VTKRDLTKVELREQDYSALLASSSDSGGEEDWAFDQPRPPPRRGQGLAALLRPGDDTEGVPDAELGREATFDAFDSKQKRSRAAAEGEESVWRVQQRQMADKRRERRKARQAEEAAGSGVGSGSDAGAGGLQDPFFAESLEGEAAFSDDDLGGREERASGGERQEARGKRDRAEAGKKKKPKRKARKGEEEEEEEGVERAAERARLELLLLGDAAGSRRGYDVRRLEVSKKRRKQPAPAEDESGFALDMDDPRFGRLFVSHDFAVDPHDPKFVRTHATEALLAEVAKRHEAMREAGAVAGGGGGVLRGVAASGSLSALVSAVKRKAAAAGAVGHRTRPPQAVPGGSKADKKAKRPRASGRAIATSQ